MSRHECKYWKPNNAGWRGYRWCNFCGKGQYKVKRHDELKWEDTHQLEWFAERWLPIISGTNPFKLMTVEVAYPFEWNCYENWNIVYRAKFEFGDDPGPLISRTYVMNGWQSSWHECWNRIDAEAEDYYHEKTGKWYDIGDNAYEAMRQIIQS